jgi:S-formylglutathione hydrolase FrmB
VLYLLHGADSDYRSWTRYGDAQAITARAPLIVVMPDGGANGWYTDWYQGARPVQPRWETYHVGELVPWIDATYRTIAARRGRAIAGLSMGGYGALSYAARHPGTFAAAASFSGALEVGSSDAWGERSANEARWRAHLPISIAARLRSLSLVELRTGDGRPGPLDRRGTKPGCGACGLERFLRAGNVRLHARLRALGIRHLWDDYGPGTHDWPYWRRDLRETLPDLLRALARA